ncbi:MAG: hypothetical protein R3293_27875, partial [Candidatus Promineifilaceae bacterium]|nr:hypothetical protein [Candidatus Promineifilaceae bacterium]
MGIGSGALLAAISYELVPLSVFKSWEVVIAFGLGAVAFFVGDWVIDHRGGTDRKDIVSSSDDGSGAAIYIGTLLDNVPESIILGMSMALGGAINLSFLVAVFVSNLPEGFAGTVNLEAAGYPRQRVFWMWSGLVLVSATCASLGYFLVSQQDEFNGHMMQAFAAGAMLTMLADAMMPEAFEHGGKTVGLFTVLGFLLAAIL